MDQNELDWAANGQPTVSHIDIAEFETLEEQRAWLAKHAPAFVRG
jgi:hypothetical protein